MRRLVLGVCALLVLAVFSAPISATASPGGTDVVDRVASTPPTYTFRPGVVARVGSTPPTYTFRPGVVFNNPTLPSQQYAVLHQILNAVANVLAGATVSIASYTIDNKLAADALIAAHRRGVNVQILTDYHNYLDGGNAEMTGSRPSSGPTGPRSSFIYACTAGCMADSSSAMMHAKFYLISTVGLLTPQATNVVMSGPVNLSTGGATNTWNEVYSDGRQRCPLQRVPVLLQGHDGGHATVPGTPRRPSPGRTRCISSRSPIPSPCLT